MDSTYNKEEKCDHVAWNDCECSKQICPGRPAIPSLRAHLSTG